MKIKFLLTILLSGLALNTKAQIYYPFVDTNKVWSIYWDYSAEGLPGLNYTYSIKFTQDTIIASKTYKKVISSNDSSQTTWFNYGYIRETPDKKVYYLLNNQDTVEKYFFNGNANVGDTMLLYNCTLVVDSIDSVLIGNNFRKRFNLGWETWIEGIGSLNGFENSGLFYCMVGGVRSLLCFTENDTLKYMNPDYNFCYNGTVGINEIKKENYYLDIYPNPFSSETTIKTFKNLQNATLTIYSTIGKELKTIKNISGQTIKLNKDNLPIGLYFIRLTQDNKIIATDKLVIID